MVNGRTGRSLFWRWRLRRSASGLAQQVRETQNQNPEICLSGVLDAVEVVEHRLRVLGFRVFVHMYVCVYACMHAWMLVCMCMYVCMYVS